MSEEPRGLFGWENPGRNLTYIVVATVFGGVLLAAWWGGAL